MVTEAPGGAAVAFTDCFNASGNAATSTSPLDRPFSFSQWACLYLPTKRYKLYKWKCIKCKCVCKYGGIRGIFLDRNENNNQIDLKENGRPSPLFYQRFSCISSGSVSMLVALASLASPALLGARRRGQDSGRPLPQTKHTQQEEAIPLDRSIRAPSIPDVKFKFQPINRHELINELINSLSIGR